MTAGSYWVELRTEDNLVLGAGFYFTSRYLLTAEHCLSDLPGDEHRVAIVHDDGTVARGLLCARDSKADLALIMLVGPSNVRPPQTDVCERGDEWRTPNRPNRSDPHLSGVVSAMIEDFDCAGGATVKVLQLREEQGLREYRGYSGSAVERVNREPALAGVLQEQYRNRLDGSDATNVLFAATMHEAIERFADYFPYKSSASAPMTPEASAPCSTDVTAMLARNTEILRQSKDWLAQGLMSPAGVLKIEVNVVRTIARSTKQVAP